MGTARHNDVLEVQPKPCTAGRVWGKGDDTLRPKSCGATHGACLRKATLQSCAFQGPRDQAGRVP